MYRLRLFSPVPVKPLKWIVMSLDPRARNPQPDELVQYILLLNRVKFVRRVDDVITPVLLLRIRERPAKFPSADSTRSFTKIIPLYAHQCFSARKIHERLYGSL